MSSASKQIKLDQATKRAADFFQRQQRKRATRRRRRNAIGRHAPSYMSELEAMRWINSRLALCRFEDRHLGKEN